MGDFCTPESLKILINKDCGAISISCYHHSRFLVIYRIQIYAESDLLVEELRAQVRVFLPNCDTYIEST